MPMLAHETSTITHAVLPATAADVHFHETAARNFGHEKLKPPTLCRIDAGWAAEGRRGPHPATALCIPGTSTTARSGGVPRRGDSASSCMQKHAAASGSYGSQKQSLHEAIRAMQISSKSLDRAAAGALVSAANATSAAYHPAATAPPAAAAAAGKATPAAAFARTLASVTASSTSGQMAPPAREYPPSRQHSTDVGSRLTHPFWAATKVRSPNSLQTRNRNSYSLYYQRSARGDALRRGNARAGAHARARTFICSCNLYLPLASLRSNPPHHTSLSSLRGVLTASSFSPHSENLRTTVVEPWQAVADL